MTKLRSALIVVVAAALAAGATRGRFRMWFHNRGVTGSRRDGASPIKAAQHSLYWATRW